MEMSFDGKFEVGIPREETFALLADPEKFVPVLPTFHSMHMKEGDANTAIVKVKVGIGRIHGLATTEMSLEESKRPVRARYVGKGSVMGSAYNMIVDFDLEDSHDGGTLINWKGTTQIHGKILSIAGGGMRGYAEKEINNIINSLQSALVSVEHFESISQRAAQAPVPSEGMFAALINFLRGLFGGAKDAPKIEESTAPVVAAKPRRKLQADPVRLLREIKTSIEVDGDNSGKWVGQHLRRKEDSRLVRGYGLFLDDYQSPDMLHVDFVTSPYAHAKILNIDVSAALALPGVRCILTGADVAAQTAPFMQMGAAPGCLVEDYGIATDTVRYTGEPVVMIVAAVGSNVIFSDTWNHGDVDAAFRDAAHVVKIKRLHFHRFASTPIETAGVVATWSPRGDIDIVSNAGLPALNAQMVAAFLNISTEQIRSRSHDIGGNFGTKTVTHTFIGLTALASRASGGATVKWCENRSDNLACFHGGERTFLDTEVALSAEGEILGLRSRHLDDCGGYTRYEPLGAVIWAQVYPATYKVRNLNIEFTQVVSNKAPCVPNRGYSRIQQLWFMERVIDICAHEIGIAADEMRLRNYIQPDQFPYSTPNGNIYDSGDYPQMLKKAMAMIDYQGWREKQTAARAQGRLLGIGIGTTLDSGTNNFGQIRLINPDAPFSGNTEAARIKLGLDGSVIVTLGSAPSGQGHETSSAQVVADVLNIGPDMVTVRSGFDSNWNSYAGLSGTIASQFVVTGLSAVHGAAQKMKSELRRLAAHALEASEQDLEFGVGETGPQLSVKGDPQRAINYWMLSNLANSNTAAVGAEFLDIDLNVLFVYKPPFKLPDLATKCGNQTLTYSAQVHISVVEVDPDTGQPVILDYVIVDDCGTQINPKIVEGQTHGAACHSIGASMQEAFQYDKSGNLITATFTDYAPMTSLNMPDIRTSSIETPSPFSYNGAKGCGEGGGAPVHSISAAVQDALFEKGVIITESHNAPSILLEAMRNPNQKTTVTLEGRA